MPRKFTEKYIITLDSKDSFTLAGREGVERKSIISAELKSPRMFFILENAFLEYMAALGFSSDIIRGVSYDELQDVKEKVLNGDIPENILEEFEDYFRLWRMEERHILLEIRLSNVDQYKKYIENINFKVINTFDSFIVEIKKCWVDAIELSKPNVIVQVTEILPYDSSGFVYVDKESGTIESDIVYGLWLPDKKVQAYDVCVADISTKIVKQYIIGDQRKMNVKSGAKVLTVPVADLWQKESKITETQLQKLLEKAHVLSMRSRRSIEFSFGIFKNEIYVHDMRDLKRDLADDQYFFADDFFSKDNKKSLFTNSSEAIANIELPFFLREDISVIQKQIERGAKTTSLLGRLKRDIKIGKNTNKENYQKVYRLNDLLQDSLGSKGFLLEFNLLLKTINNLEKSSPTQIHSILENTRNSIESNLVLIKDLNKEIIFRLSKIETKGLHNLRPEYFGKTLELSPIRKLGLEIMIFKDLIENQSHDYISLSLPPLRTFEELEFLLSVLKLSEYSAIKDNTAKLYVDLSIPSMLFEYSKKALPKKYLMDGLIINLFEFMSTFFNKEIFTERDYKLATEYLKTNLESVRNSIHYLNLVVKENEDVSKIVKELGVDQIIIDSQV